MGLQLLIFFALMTYALAEPKYQSTWMCSYDNKMRDIKQYDERVVFATCGTDLLYSNDTGFTWSVMSLPSNRNSKWIYPDQIFISPVDKAILIKSTVGDSAFWEFAYWVSRDAGRTWTIHSPNIQVSFLTFLWHPVVPGYLLSGAQQDFISIDYGQTWHPTPFYQLHVEEYYWGDSGVGEVSNMTSYVRTSSGEIYASIGDGAVKVQDNSYDFYTTNDHMILVAGSHLAVSPDIGRIKKEFFAPFPWTDQKNNTKKTQFNVVGDTDRSISIVVDGDLYHSDARIGAEYTRIFSRINNYDWNVVRGFGAVQFINRLTKVGLNNNIRSYMSFDHGSTWDTIKTKDENCTKPCSVHLVPSTIVTSAVAPGVIMAKGNFGESLVDDYSQDWITLMSTDNGLNFKKVSNGGSLFGPIAEGAGVVVWWSGKLYYTLDFGRTIQTLNLSISVSKIEYYGQDTFMLIDRGLQKVTAVKFNALARECHLATDYEEFVPYNGVKGAGRCMMGRHIVYRRRKADVTCRNPANFTNNLVVSVTSCLCTMSDYECDYSYERDEKGECVRDNMTTINDPPTWCKIGQKYRITKGYRLQAGNNCKGGVQMDYLEKDCPAQNLH